MSGGRGRGGLVADAVDAIQGHGETLLKDLAAREGLARSTGFAPDQA